MKIKMELMSTQEGKKLGKFGTLIQPAILMNHQGAIYPLASIAKTPSMKTEDISLSI